nr:MAG TPA: hypothetical protein [Caudoviricetes sp.]
MAKSLFYLRKSSSYLNSASVNKLSSYTPFYVIEDTILSISLCISL